MTFRSSLLLLATFFFSCSNFYMIRQNYHEDIKPDSEKAVIVIYRSTSYGFNSKVDIFLNNKFIGQTKGKCYLITKAEPGTHYLSMIAENKICAQLTLEAGRIYYILQTMYPGKSSIQCGLSESDSDNFLKEIAGLEFLTIAENKKALPILKEDFNLICCSEQQKKMHTLKFR